MDLDNEVFDWIERYLTKEMSSEEVLHFEMLMNNDASLMSKVERQRTFGESLLDFRARNLLQQKLNEFHSEMPIEELVKEYTPKFSKIYNLWKKHRVGLAVAASVAILAVSGSMYYMNLKKMDGQYSQVRALRRDMESIQKSQHVIISTLGHRPSLNAGSGNYGGTGFLIDNSGYLVTNFHVVDGADSVLVQNNRGITFKTNVVFRDEKYDLAILQIKDSNFHMNEPLPYTFRKVHPELGEHIFTLGFPRDEIVYNEGYLSASTGFMGDTINYQLSIAVNPGNSGGPVLDNQGDVVGIISGSQTKADGVAFAIRSSYLVKALNEPMNDSLHRRINIPMKLAKSNSLNGLRREQQVKKLKEDIFIVRAYN